MATDSVSVARLGRLRRVFSIQGNLRPLSQIAAELILTIARLNGFTGPSVLSTGGYFAELHGTPLLTEYFDHQVIVPEEPSCVRQRMAQVVILRFPKNCWVCRKSRGCRMRRVQQRLTWHPVFSIICAAASGVVISPFPITGIFSTASTTFPDSTQIHRSIKSLCPSSSMYKYGGNPGIFKCGRGRERSGFDHPSPSASWR